MEGINEIQVIFDSRKAKEYYSEYRHSRGQSFIIPPGYVGIVEVIAPEDYMHQITFTAIMKTMPSSGENDCWEGCRSMKRYRRWKCCQSLGNKDEGGSGSTIYTSYNKSIVFWGLDPMSNDIVEFEYLTRPGNYFIQVDKCLNDVMDDCDNPILVQLSIVKVSAIPDLNIPCYSEC